MVEFTYCEYCGNKYKFLDAINHSLCSDYYHFLLSEKICYAKQQLDICLELQKKIKK